MAPGALNDDDKAAIREALRYVGHVDECRSHRDGPETCDCGSDDALRKARDALGRA